MSRAAMKFALVLTIAVLGAFGCGGGDKSAGDGAPAGDGGTGDGGGFSQLRGLSIAVAATGNTGPIFPYDPTTRQNVLVIRYKVTLQNRGPDDLYDLRVVVPFPKALAGSGEMKISGGWVNGAIGAGVVDINWMSPDHGSLTYNVEIRRDPKLLQPTNTERMNGVVDIRAVASVVQYNREIARSGEVSIKAHVPELATKEEFNSFQQAERVGPHLYVAAIPRLAALAGRGGVYRLSVADGSITKVVQHPRTDLVAPFWAEADKVYVATVGSMDPNWTWRLVWVPPDGTGTPTELPLPADTTQINALASDATHLFVLLQMRDGGHYLHRLDKATPAQGALTSARMGGLMRYTISVTSKDVYVRATDPPAILRLSKDTLTISKFADLKSTPDDRSLMCTDTYCFWSEWSGGLWQLPTTPTAGWTDPLDLVGTNQRFTFGGGYFYTGINGMVRVGPGRKPAAARLMETVLLPVLAADDKHVYFHESGRIWRLAH